MGHDADELLAGVVDASQPSLLLACSAQTGEQSKEGQAAADHRGERDQKEGGAEGAGERTLELLARLFERDLPPGGWDRFCDEDITPVAVKPNGWNEELRRGWLGQCRRVAGGNDDAVAIDEAVDHGAAAAEGRDGLVEQRVR